MAIYEKVETVTHEDQDGNITVDESKVTRMIKRNEEPDYIKIYTKMWCEFNGVPVKYQNLFFALAIRMGYCDKNNLAGSQLVDTREPYQKGILRDCGWKTRDPLAKGLKVLCDAGVIKKVIKGVYQINPMYAGKGLWRYDPKRNNGGIEDLVTVFRFKDKDVNTEIFYQDAGMDEDSNMNTREAFDAKQGESLVLTMTEIKDKNTDKKTDNKSDNLSENLSVNDRLY